MINKKTMIIMTRSSVMQHSQMAFWHGSRAKGPQLCWILALLAGCTLLLLLWLLLLFLLVIILLLILFLFTVFIIINMIIIIIIIIVIIFIFIMIVIMHCWQAALALLVQGSISWSHCAVLNGSHAAGQWSLGRWACCQATASGG